MSFYLECIDCLNDSMFQLLSINGKKQKELDHTFDPENSTWIIRNLFDSDFLNIADNKCIPVSKTSQVFNVTVQVSSLP